MTDSARQNYVIEWEVWSRSPTGPYDSYGGPIYCVLEFVADSFDDAVARARDCFDGNDSCIGDEYKGYEVMGVIPHYREF